MITFNQLWNFIKTTYVTDNVLHLIDSNTGTKIPTKLYIIENSWEKRFDLKKLKIFWENKFTFIVHCSSINSSVKNLIEEIEKYNNVQCQSHVYAGKIGSKSFSIHCDNPDNLIIQCIGKSKVTIYNEYGNFVGDIPKKVTIKEERILTPGQSIFIPSLQYHLFEPLTDRLSISIPMIKK